MNNILSVSYDDTNFAGDNVDEFTNLNAVGNIRVYLGAVCT